MPSKQKEGVSKFYNEMFEALPSMAGKVVAITGCTTGLGLVTATACAQKGAGVVMLNRPSSRADNALATVQEAAAQSVSPDEMEAARERISFLACDLSSFASVRQAAASLRAMYGGPGMGIDVLCNNAGVMALDDMATEDGCDVQMQTNHLSHFLLTCEIMPLLEEAAKLRGDARIVNHSSMRRKGQKLQAEYLGKNGGSLGGNKGKCCQRVPFNGPNWQRYQQSKLANVVFTYALQDRLAKSGSKVKALVAHPGMADTNLQVTAQESGGMSSFLGKAWIISQSAHDGAMGILRCCCCPDVVQGGFYGPVSPLGFEMYGRAVEMPIEKLASDEDSKNMLWSESEKSVGTVFTL